MIGKKNIVISADDFGKSATANKNILDLAKLGKTDRVSVMVNGSFSKEEVEELLKSKVKLDIHLETPRMANGEWRMANVFYRSIQFIFLYLTRRISTEKIEKEWNNQIGKFVNLFDKFPDGLNSHEHVHFFPPYFKIALELCKRYNISYLRYGKKGIIANYSIIGWIIKILNLINRRHSSCFMLHVSSSISLVSLDWINNFENFLKKPPTGTTEIVCHPEREGEYKKILDYPFSLK